MDYGLSSFACFFSGGACKTVSREAWKYTVKEKEVF